MSDIHIDDFYKDAAKILIQLYRFFPKRSMILAEDISGLDIPDEYGLHSDRHQASFGAMLWLAESGYIDYQETIRQEGLDQAILNHRGFTLLSAEANFIADDSTSAELPPSLLLSRKSNIHQMREALKANDSHQIRQVVQHFLMQSL